MKKILLTFANIFGIPHNSKYVKKYLNKANMRSGIFMSAIIVILEIWLVIRQFHKYIIPQLQGGAQFFQSVFTNTSNFWLLMSFGVAMFFYCIYYTDERKRKWVFWTAIGGAIASIIFVCFIPFEFHYNSIKFTNIRNDIAGGLKIALYSSVLLFDLAVIGALIYSKRGGTKSGLTSVLIISLFATVCLVFGIMVSFGDFTSSAKFDSGEYQHKQIICFLMMSIYVGCLLIWKPYISIGILGTVFLGFYLLLHYISTWTPGAREFPEGDEVNYITFLISLIMICVSIYDQRVSEAKKDEELEYLATKDPLTGLLSFEYFATLVNKTVKENETKLDEWIYLFMDITSFKIFNEQKGFEEGNKFLSDVGKVLTEKFETELITRQSDDHFVVFERNIDIQRKLDEINNEVEKLDLDIRPGIKVGGYILRDKNEDPHQSVEKARYALSVIKHTNMQYMKYDTEMHDGYRLVQYVVRHIDEAIEKEYVRPYYQPVVWSKGRKLCGAEALARWIDPKYGFLSPGVFVPALESSQLIYKLDIAVLRFVCRQMRENLDKGLPIFPVSINFSRVDFNVVDIVSIIEETVKEFNIPKKMLHIEITESALTKNVEALKKSMDRLHKAGYEIWLDDFGSGYSSFNVLKDFKFDVIKLDMELLSGFKDNEKSRVIIPSVLNMAKELGINTLSEGVETKEEASFLEKADCGRLQGYLYGKPLPYEELKAKLDSGELEFSPELLKK